MDDTVKALEWITEFLNYEEFGRSTYEDTCGTGDLTNEEREKLYAEMDEQINMFKAIKSALEKQLPKKVYHFSDDTFETTCCGIDITNTDYKYCPECGCLLGKVEEVEDNDE